MNRLILVILGIITFSCVSAPENWKMFYDSDLVIHDKQTGNDIQMNMSKDKFETLFGNPENFVKELGKEIKFGNDGTGPYKIDGLCTIEFNIENNRFIFPRDTVFGMSEQVIIQKWGYPTYTLGEGLSNYQGDKMTVYLFSGETKTKMASRTSSYFGFFEIMFTYNKANELSKVRFYYSVYNKS